MSYAILVRAKDWPLGQHPHGHWEEAKFDEAGNLLPPPPGVLFVLEKWDREKQERREKEERERERRQMEELERKRALLISFRNSFVGQRLHDSDDENN